MYNNAVIVSALGDELRKRMKRHTAATFGCSNRSLTVLTYKHKLILVCDQFPYNRGDSHFIMTEFTWLARYFDITVVNCDQKAGSLTPLPEGVRFVHYKSTPRIRRALRYILRFEWIRQAARDARRPERKSFFSVLRATLAEYALAKDFERFLRKQALIDPDENTVLYSYWLRYPVLAASYLKRDFAKLRIISRAHGCDLYNERSTCGVQPWRKPMDEALDMLVFACEYGRQYYLRTLNKDPNGKYELSYIGSLRAQRVKPRQNVILSCSTAIPLKRIELMVDALALASEHRELEWYHIGDGERLNAVRARARQKLKNVKWSLVGAMSNEEIKPFYADIGASLFLTASSTEGGVPVTIQDAFSCHIPAVATAVGGISEIVRDGKTGFLVSSDPTARELADAIERYLGLPDIDKEQMSSAAAHLAETLFNAETNAERMITLIGGLFYANS